MCFWEDDPTQLRYPLSDDGANGVSLAEAQEVYRRTGAMDRDLRRKVRPARPDEPLDPGWRPFDPALDWTDPVLAGDQWPVNGEALYYWRPTYWNGDQHALPAPPREQTNGDRLIEHLGRLVPEIRHAIAASERRWGSAGAGDVCAAAGRLARSAYDAGDDELGLRIVAAIAPALDAESDIYAPIDVSDAFLESGGWYGPSVRAHVDGWPAPMRDEVLRVVRHQAGAAERQRAWTDLWRTGRGRPVDALVRELRDLRDPGSDHPQLDLAREMQARLMSEPRWIYRHPIDSARLVWRYRHVRSPWHIVRGLIRPRFAG